MNQNTSRVLSFDGGGARGYISICFLEKIIKHPDLKMTEQEFINSFDVIAGTSIGGIIALSLSFGLSIKEVKVFFTEKAKRIFTTQSLYEIFTKSTDAKKDSYSPSKFRKLIMIANGFSFYESRSSQSNYGSALLYQILIDIFGNSTLKDLKKPIVIPAYQKNTNKVIFFSNVDNELYTGRNTRIADVACATSAAPMYFPPYSFDGNTYIDGGIFCNNPTLIAISLVKSIKIYSKKLCILSIGTGIQY
jgi:patatin-like phospholipase/acyl hydrolase